MMLRRGTSEQIQSYMRKMQKEVDEILKECGSLAYWMRGGLQYDSAKLISVPERRLLNEFLNARLEAESKNPYPNY